MDTVYKDMPEYEISIDGKPAKIEITKSEENRFSAKIDGRPIDIELPKPTTDFEKPFSLKIQQKIYRVEIPSINTGEMFSLKVDDVPFKAEIKIPLRKTTLTTFSPETAVPGRKTGPNRQIAEGAITAPMTGKIVSVMVRKGERVKQGQTLCVIEAMKMENEIAAPKPGTVKDVYVEQNSPVSEGEALLVII